MKTSALIWAFLFCASCTPPPKEANTSVEDSLALVRRDSIIAARKDSIARAEAYLNRPWQLDSFVDEFNQPTKDKFIWTASVGSFSNSAASNAELYVRIFVTPRVGGIFLHEYNKDRPAEKLKARIKMRNSAGSTIELYAAREWSQSGGILIDNFYERRNYNMLKAFIRKSTGKIMVVIYDEYSSIYRFEFDATGFDVEYSSLSK